MLNKISENRNLSLLPDLWENIESLTIKYEITCSCFIDVPYQFEQFPSIVYLLRISSTNKLSIFSSNFSVIIG